MRHKICYKQVKYTLLFSAIGIIFIVLYPANGSASTFTIPASCSEGVCHSGSPNGYTLSQSSFDNNMNYFDRFDTKFNSNMWPNLDPDCKQSGCHVITNPISGNPNLKVQHIGLQTTSFPSGMQCSSCHHGDTTVNQVCANCHDDGRSGALHLGNPSTKLPVANLDFFIYWWEDDCNFCHGQAADHEYIHDTDYLTSKTVKCEKCHSMVSSKTGEPNLWEWHIDRQTTSYPSGMECNSCHNYSGSKLVKANIDSAISSANKNCNSCHSTTMHNLDPNTEHRTNFLGDTSCKVCHKPSRTAKDSRSNLQDLHVGKKTTSYPDGMDCNSCHDYTGSKLILSRINNAINSGVNGNARCDACHSIGNNVHLTPHDTSYLESDKLVDCTFCHPMKSKVTGQPNLRKWHIGRKTTSYPEGMDCASCHDYKGRKLSKSTVNEAISANDTTCEACHSRTMHDLDPNSSHRTDFMDGTDFCTNCHNPSRASADSRPNLQDYHIGKKTSTYKKGMTCNSCHRYNGAKLSKAKVKKAIAKGGYGGTPSTECASCHNVRGVLRHEVVHNTKYESALWPNSLDPDCRKCHQMESTTQGNAGNPNLWKWHLDRKTTTYNEGMNCKSCHNYQGSKLRKVDIDKAIEESNTDCISCHKDNIDITHEKKHDTPYLDNPPVDCSTCHEMTSPVTGNANLWKWHLNRQTTTYSAASGYIEGMSCNSCHDYKGDKLALIDVQTAIDTSNTSCDSCHEQTMHKLDPNTDHRTDFMGEPEKCTFCHPFARNKKDVLYNLQDIHIGKRTTSFPKGMDCNSCHSYRGKKLKKQMIVASIARGGYDGEPYTRCDGCHTEVGPHDRFKKANDGKAKKASTSGGEKDNGFLSSFGGKALIAIGSMALTVGLIGLAVTIFRKPPTHLHFPHIFKFIRKHFG